MALEPNWQAETNLLEEEMDAVLGVHTCGRLAYQEDRVHYPYEPTPYVVLEALYKSGQVGIESFLVDYGCGKGRVAFFAAGVIGCRAMGVEMDSHLYHLALENLASFQEKARERENTNMALEASRQVESGFLENKLSFFHGGAEEFSVPLQADRFFFFNPFSQVILARVVDHLLDSFYAKPRDMRLIYYYADGETARFLCSRRELTPMEEIDVSRFFPQGKEREKLLVLQIQG